MHGSSPLRARLRLVQHSTTPTMFRHALHGQALCARVFTGCQLSFLSAGLLAGFSNAKRITLSLGAGKNCRCSHTHVGLRLLGGQPFPLLKNSDALELNAARDRTPYHDWHGPCEITTQARRAHHTVGQSMVGNGVLLFLNQDVQRLIPPAAISVHPM